MQLYIERRINTLDRTLPFELDAHAISEFSTWQEFPYRGTFDIGFVDWVKTAIIKLKNGELSLDTAPASVKRMYEALYANAVFTPYARSGLPLSDVLFFTNETDEFPIDAIDFSIQD